MIVFEVLVSNLDPRYFRADVHSAWYTYEWGAGDCAVPSINMGCKGGITLLRTFAAHRHNDRILILIWSKREREM